MSFVHSRFGNWLFRNGLYRFYWWRGDRNFYKWVKYGKDHGHIVGIVSSGQSLEHVKGWMDEMIQKYSKRSFLNIFKK